MALTRAQLLAGNRSQGDVLAGQVQAVTAGTAVSISNTGVLSIDVSALTPLLDPFYLKLNNSGAYNAYAWPNFDGTAGAQLTTDGSGNLSWEDADSIPWTQKGQLVVGTGLGTQAILDPGTATSFLVVDPTATTGLNYTSNITSAAQAPVGDSLQRPLTPSQGQFRFNSDLDLMEVYAAGQWIPIGAAIQAGLGINLSGSAPNEMYKLETPIQTGPPPAGTLPAEAIDGSLYWDNTQGLLFIRYDDTTSTQWVQVIPSAPPATIFTGTAPIVVSGSNISLDVGLGNQVDGGFLKADTPIQTGPPAAGSGQLQAIDGSLYWDNTQGLLFIRYNDTSSTQWVQVTPVTPAPSGYSGSFLSQGGQTVTVVNGIITTVV